MHQPVYSAADNIEALIAAVRTHAIGEVFLGPHMNGRLGGNGRELFSVEGVLPDLPYFRELGVRRQADSWAPVIAGADGVPLDPVTSLNRLFGPICGIDAYDALFQQFGVGAWDPGLIGDSGARVEARDLLLERLYLAARALDWERRIGPARAAQEIAFYSDNLDRVEAAVQARDCTEICLNRFVSPPGRLPVQFCMAGLVTIGPHFGQYGVFPDADLPGAPVAVGPGGKTLCVVLTLNHLFGEFGEVQAFDVLFKSYTDGRWDTHLVVNNAGVDHKELCLARIRAWRNWMLAHAGEQGMTAAAGLAANTGE